MKNIIVAEEEEKRMKFERGKSKAVGLFENGVLVRKWKSANKCAKDMCYTQTMISKYCNGKVQKPQFDLRWL